VTTLTFEIDNYCLSCRIVSDIALPGPISSVLMIKDGKTIIVGASDGVCVCYIREFNMLYMFRYDVCV